MRKSKINITMDQDLIDYAKSYASLQRTTVSEVFTQFVLHLRRVHDDDPTQALLDDPGFRDSLLRTMAKIQSGEARWSPCDEIVRCHDHSSCADETVKFVQIGPHDKAYKNVDAERVG